MAVARGVANGIEGLTLVAVSARDRERAAARISDIPGKVAVLPAEELAAAADVVVECAPAAVFASIAAPAVEAGRVLVPISIAALLDHPGIIERAGATGARIVVPSGALLGLDAVRAAAEGTIHSVRMITRKPPGGLSGAPYLVEHGISVDGIDKPLRVFAGSARDGARGFPANLNVAAALGFAGVGPERTELEIWADPTVTRNCHHIVVEAEEARFELKIENVPTEENPRTGRLVALSVIATLRRLVSPLVIGT
jgi:aspartate dehydrogenase